MFVDCFSRVSFALCSSIFVFVLVGPFPCFVLYFFFSRLSTGAGAACCNSLCRRFFSDCISVERETRVYAHRSRYILHFAWALCNPRHVLVRARARPATIWLKWICATPFSNLSPFVCIVYFSPSLSLSLCSFLFHSICHSVRCVCVNAARMFYRHLVRRATAKCDTNAPRTSTKCFLNEKFLHFILSRACGRQIRKKFLSLKSEGLCLRRAMAKWKWLHLARVVCASVNAKWLINKYAIYFVRNGFLSAAQSERARKLTWINVI